MKKEMKLFLPVLILTIILLNLFLVAAATPAATKSIPKQVFDFFNNFTAGTQGFIVSLIPIIILIFISYFFIKKGNRTSIATQWLFWIIYLVYMLAKVFATLNIYFNWNILPANYSVYLINPPATLELEAYKWFYYSIIINTAAALLFSLKNNWIVSIFSKFKNKPCN